MSTPFERAFQQTIAIEGGYSDDPNDKGSKTRYGITEGVARAHGYAGDMRDLPLETAHAIAKLEYWDKFRGDDIAAVFPTVASELFDTAYNCGAGTACQFLQRSLNAFNHDGVDYPDIAVDSAVGTGTLAALTAYVRKRGRDGELVLHRALESLKGARYIEIAEKDRTQSTFVFGWIQQRLGLS